MVPDTVEATLEAMVAPARLVKSLAEERDRALAEAKRLAEQKAQAEALASALQAEVGRLTAELARTAPVSPFDEQWLAERVATLTYRMPLMGERAGRVEVTLTGAKINPKIGSTAAEVLDQARGRQPVKRRERK